MANAYTDVRVELDGELLAAQGHNQHRPARHQFAPSVLLEEGLHELVVRGRIGYDHDRPTSAAEAGDPILLEVQFRVRDREPARGISSIERAIRFEEAGRTRAGGESVYAEQARLRETPGDCSELALDQIWQCDYLSTTPEWVELSSEGEVVAHNVGQFVIPASCTSAMLHLGPVLPGAAAILPSGITESRPFEGEELFIPDNGPSPYRTSPPGYCALGPRGARAAWPFAIVAFATLCRRGFRRSGWSKPATVRCTT